MTRPAGLGAGSRWSRRLAGFAVPHRDIPRSARKGCRIREHKGMAGRPIFASAERADAGVTPKRYGVRTPLNELVHPRSGSLAHSPPSVARSASGATG